MILLGRDFWEVKTTPKKGRGVFATKDITAGTVIGDYIGKVIKTAEEDIYEKDEATYLMYYHDRASIYPMDIRSEGIHLLNHSCAPNSWMYTYRGHTLFFAIRHIFKGEEVTVSYLLSPKDALCNPCKDLCYCDGPVCYGTMHLSDDKFDRWNEFNEKQENATKRKRITYGKELPKLASYPSSIPDAPIYDLFGSTIKPSLVVDGKTLPDASTARRLIRETGRTIQIPMLKTKVIGVRDDKLILESI